MANLAAWNCLVWATERPYADISRQSSNFWVQDGEYNFKLFIKDNCFIISVNCVSGFRLLRGSCATFVRGRNQEICCCRVGDFPGTIWSCSKDTAEKTMGCDQFYGRWNIYFCASKPFTLQRQLRKEKGDLHIHKCVQASPMDILPDMESLSHDFSQLLGHKNFSDVQLRCGDRSIHAHKNILASRSDVFAAMFRNKMAESETGIVDVTDMDADVLDMFLKYVYSGKIPELSDDIASGLYAAGDKYSVHGLKKTCSDWMVGSLTEENCLGFLILAEAHSDEGFKDRVASFVAENLESLEKQAWFEFSRNHSGLALIVYHKRYDGSTLSE